MFLGNPAVDLILAISTVMLLKHYLFLKEVNDEERRFIYYSNKYIRIIIVLSIAGELAYIVGSDIALFDGEYYIQCISLCGITIYLCALWGIYMGYKYGPKTYEYKESLKTRILAAIVLPLIFILMYFF